MCSSFPLKLGGEDEVLESSLRATIEACGFMSKAMGARASSSTCGIGQYEQGREKLKNAHFCKRGGGGPGISIEAVGWPNGGQREPHGLGKQALKAWARRWRVCVFVCVCV